MLICLNITSYDARHHIGPLISPLSHPYRLNKATCRFRTCISFFHVVDLTGKLVRMMTHVGKPVTGPRSKLDALTSFTA
jgi:hypothetical protein